MSINVMSWYWKHSEQDGHRLLALLALADWCTDDGECYPGIKALAKRIRRDERSAQRIVKELEQAGELLVYPGMGQGADGRRSTLYYLVKYREAHDIVIPPMIAEAARHYRQIDRRNGIKGLDVRKAQAALSGDTDVTPTGDTDVTPTGDTDVTPTGDTDVTLIRHIDPSLDPSLDPSAPSARARLESNAVPAQPPAPPPATLPGAEALRPKPPLLANDSFDMPVTANTPSPRSGSPLPHEPTAAQLQRWAPKVDPRKFRSGYIPADTGVTPVEVWYESFPVTDTQTRLTAPDQDDLRVCTDLDRLRTVIATYRRCDFKRKRNIQLVLDWYRDGVPERYTGGPPSNGANGVNFGLAAYAAKERAQHERDFGPDPEPDPEKERRVREYFERRAKAAH